MLPAQARMRRPSEFSAAMRRGPRSCRVVRPTLVLHAQLDPTGPKHAIVGFAVSKAVGSAVVRNRVKRRLRHAVRPHLSRLPSGIRVVIRAQPAAAAAAWDVLRGDVDAGLAEALRRTTGKRAGG